MLCLDHFRVLPYHRCNSSDIHSQSQYGPFCTFKREEFSFNFFKQKLTKLLDLFKLSRFGKKKFLWQEVFKKQYWGLEHWGFNYKNIMNDWISCEYKKNNDSKCFHLFFKLKYVQFLRSTFKFGLYKFFRRFMTMFCI